MLNRPPKPLQSCVQIIKILFRDFFRAKTTFFTITYISLKYTYKLLAQLEIFCRAVIYLIFEVLVKKPNFTFSQNIRYF